MNRSVRGLGALAGIIALAMWAFWHWGLPPFAQQQQQGRAGVRFGAGNSGEVVPVLAASARAADVPVYLGGVGTVQAFNTVLVRTQVDGKLMKIGFTEGKEVVQGSVIAKIDPTLYQAQYDQAVAKKAQDEAQLANARLDLQRYIKLAATNAVQTQQVDTQRSLVDQLVAQTQADQGAIDNAKGVLDYTAIVAPLTGVTGIRQVDEGNIVHATDTTGIVTITQIKPVAVLFSLPQQDLPYVKRVLSGGRLQAQAMTLDGTAVIDDGRVIVLNNQIDQTTGAVQLKAEFPNVNVQLWPGQFVNVRVLIDTLHGAIVVPIAAVQDGPDGQFVYIVNDDSTVALRPVTVKPGEDRQAVISSGVSAQERVVLSGFGRLTDGSKVEVASADPNGAAPDERAQPSPRSAGGGARRSQAQPAPSNTAGQGAQSPLILP